MNDYLLGVAFSFIILIYEFIDAECPDDSTCECTMFTTQALTHGGWGGGEYAGCSTLWNNFKSGKYAGWVKSSGNVIGKG